MDIHTHRFTDTPLLPVYLVWQGETLLKATPAEAWPHILNYTSWQSYPICEPISGRRGEEGEVVRLRKDETGFAFPPYYARTVRLEPGRRVIWKTFPERADSGLDFFGFVEFSVTEAPGGTRFQYRFLYEFLLPPQEESQIEAFRQQQYANTEAMFASVLPKLRRLVEKER